MIQPNLPSALQIVSTFVRRNPGHRPLLHRAVAAVPRLPPWSLTVRVRSFSTNESEIADAAAAMEEVCNKPSVCTADELHYVSVPNTNWRLALWRHFPSPQILLLHRGVAAVRRLPPRSLTVRVRSFSTNESEIPDAAAAGEKVGNKPSVCTADELHYVSVPNTNWRLALWRYFPSPEAPPRNHPLLLLSGVGTNAIEYDLSPLSSFARYMCGQGFDTWILEVRGSGLSMQKPTLEGIEQSAQELSDQMKASAQTATDKGFRADQRSRNNISSTLVDADISLVKEDQPRGMGTALDESIGVTKLTGTFMHLSERLSGFLSEGQSQIMSARFFDQISRLLEDSFLYERFNELFNLQELFSTTIDDLQKQLDVIVKYDWDFDHYLEEDVPAAMEYVRAQTKPRDGKLLAVGHSMGGFKGREPGLAAIGTLASSLDYTSSKSVLKLFLPLADPAQALNVPVPLGAFLSAVYPLSSRLPYVSSWLNLISAEDMMHPELLRKLVMNGFCTIPTELLLQLTTAFRKGGLQNRSGMFFYKDHLHKSTVPVLALAGDEDLICPPEAVYETVKLIPEHLVTYKVYGESEGPHYAHYDLVAARLAGDQVYPRIVQFLSSYD
ncbi:uncharacterized protein LOC127806185 [Diospyros lotus]|uniref:uncharacterized protein LOC127806185 n=1 Tax=Diospyros lotus TaxID=55363 RepID=UPI0022565ACD|nr:uncharacterized protein LOC127806185 [Diospyros lotus]